MRSLIINAVSFVLDVPDAWVTNSTQGFLGRQKLHRKLRGNMTLSGLGGPHAPTSRRETAVATRPSLRYPSEDVLRGRIASRAGAGRRRRGSHRGRNPRFERPLSCTADGLGDLRRRRGRAAAIARDAIHAEPRGRRHGRDVRTTETARGRAPELEGHEVTGGATTTRADVAREHQSPVQRAQAPGALGKRGGDAPHARPGGYRPHRRRRRANGARHHSRTRISTPATQPHPCARPFQAHEIS